MAAGIGVSASTFALQTIPALECDWKAPGAPTSAPVGTAVTITGTNFGPTPTGNTVSFNGTLATATTWTTTSLVVPVPVGATSGNVQTVRAMRYDCDADAVLALVEPAGPACHTGERTCFFRSLTTS